MPSTPPGSPPIRPQPISSLCSLGLRPHLVTGLLRHVIGDHFAQRENVQEPALQDLLWRAKNVGNILIESVTRWKPEALGQRPAVIIRRGDWSAEKILIGDQAGNTPQADPIYLNLMHGSHTLFCISGSGEEAEILAAEVFYELLGFVDVIRRTLDLIRFVPMGLGQSFELEEAHENYAVPVNVAYVGKNVWTVHEHAPRLTGITLSASDLAP